MADEFLAIMFAGADTVLRIARRITAEECAAEHYAAWMLQAGLVPVPPYDDVPLPCVTLADAPDRPSDGMFAGCGNTAYIVSQAEWDAYVALNAERAEAKRRKTESETREYMREIVRAAERQGGACTREEAKRRAADWINAYNEGGEGYVPHYVTTDELDDATRWLAEHPD